MDIGMTLHLAHASLSEAKSSMPPPLQTYNSVLGRTIHNIEQAQGINIHHATMRDILQADDTEHADMTSLPSTSDMVAISPPSSDGSAEAVVAPNYITTVNLISDLNCSTALLRNLRTCNSILVADLARVNGSLTHHEDKTAAILLIESRRKVKWMAIAAFTFALWSVYLLWCWFMSVEFEYIRKRRGEVFGL
jgi:hypothetical protein